MGTVALSNRTQLFVSSHLLLAANACSASLSPQSLAQGPKPTVSVLAHCCCSTLWVQLHSTQLHPSPRSLPVSAPSLLRMGPKPTVSVLRTARGNWLLCARVVALAAKCAFGRGMSDGVAASAGTIRARFAVSTVSCIFAYRAIFGAILISGNVSFGELQAGG